MDDENNVPISNNPCTGTHYNGKALTKANCEALSCCEGD